MQSDREAERGSADGGSPGGATRGDTEGEGRSLQHLYAQSLEGTEDRFHRRNGVFYPSGFALLALPDAAKVKAAVGVLTAEGLPESEITLLRPDQMRHLARESRHDAGLLSRIVSAELKQMTVLEQLADAGNHFLLVKHSDEIRNLLQTVGARAGVSKGLLFRALAIEELPVDRETIPGTSPYGVNEVIRTQDSDADLSGGQRPEKG